MGGTNIHKENAGDKRNAFIHSVCSVLLPFYILNSTGTI